MPAKPVLKYQFQPSDGNVISDVTCFVAKVFKPTDKNEKERRKAQAVGSIVLSKKSSSSFYFICKKITFYFNMFEQFSEEELKTLLAVCRIFYKRREEVKQYATQEEASGIDLVLPPGSPMVSDNVLNGLGGELDTSLYEIAKERNLKIGGSSYKIILDSLKRLANCTIDVEYYTKHDDVKGRTLFTTRLLKYVFISVQKGDRVYEKLKIMLNPLAVSAIFGCSFTGYIPQIDQHVFRFKGIASILLAYLSSYIAPGRKKSFDIDELAAIIWSEDMVRKKPRYCRYKLRKAMQEINNLPSWEVFTKDKKTYIVKRLKSLKNRSC